MANIICSKNSVESRPLIIHHTAFKQQRENDERSRFFFTEYEAGDAGEDRRSGKWGYSVYSEAEVALQVCNNTSTCHRHVCAGVFISYCFHCHIKSEIRTHSPSLPWLFDLLLLLHFPHLLVNFSNSCFYAI